ncbi:ATP-binding protein [Streptomyces sp. ME19-01-6]|uniref:ATP-binding protein n=1 Tax=Streptomyces sp. ME19-01-6 TaxID=3028686 RepID=UPI0029B92B21|nr:ATP-binding protein [Streptomyces sp. ME19-01-6]MDX3224446.1 ATP-binding protein [Streptomyces sp. ME19-01-6]
MLSGTAGVIAVASALLVLTSLLGSLWVARLRKAVAGARTAAERERAAAAEARAEAERERAAAERERAAAAERGEEVARLAAVRAELDEAARRERSLRDSVQASFESVARNVHAMAVVQQQVLDGLEQRISEAAVMAEVMKADHAAAQMTRKAQTLMVMCGIWPARRETRPVTLFDCVRGAQSRIVEFGRVDVHGGQTLYVMAPVVEGLMHAVAELLENATVFSPSRTQVAVSIREVAAGAVIEIDDAGLGMPPEVLEQAVAQLQDGLDLAQLGAVPRLGLACVGRWSRELGFGVELSTASAYGGTRVVVFVPHRLLGGSAEPVVNAEPVVVEPVTVPAAPATAPAGTESGAGVDSGSGAGLPQRRNRRRTNPKAPRAEAHVPDPGSAASTGDPWTPEAARASIASIVSGTRRGRAEVAKSDRQDRADREGGR